MFPYTEGLFNSIPNLRERGEELQPIKGMMPNPMDLPEGCAFAERCPYQVEACLKAQPPLVQVGPTHYVACILRQDQREDVGRDGNE